VRGCVVPWRGPLGRWVAFHDAESGNRPAGVQTSGGTSEAVRDRLGEMF